MFIRTDLLICIRNIYQVEKFFYMKTTKDTCEKPLLLFYTDKDFVGIVKTDTGYRISNYYVSHRKLDRFYSFQLEKKQLLYYNEEENKTVLEEIDVFMGKKITEFPGKAFNFDKEFIIATLENGGGSH